MQTVVNYNEERFYHKAKMMENVVGAKLRAAVEYQSLSKQERSRLDPIEGPKILAIHAEAPRVNMRSCAEDQEEFENETDKDFNFRMEREKRIILEKEIRARVEAERRQSLMLNSDSYANPQSKGLASQASLAPSQSRQTINAGLQTNQSMQSFDIGERSMDQLNPD